MLSALLRYGEGNVMYKSYQNYANLLLRGDSPASVTKAKAIPEVYVTAAEFETCLAASDSDKSHLQTWNGERRIDWLLSTTHTHTHTHMHTHTHTHIRTRAPV